MSGVCRRQASVEGHPRHARRGDRAAAAARACMRGVDRRFAARCRRLKDSASTACFARHVAPAGLWPAASCDIPARVAAAERRVPHAFLAKRGSSASGTSRPSTARPAGPVIPQLRRAMSRTSCTACMPRDSSAAYTPRRAENCTACALRPQRADRRRPRPTHIRPSATAEPAIGAGTIVAKDMPKP
jgi:hypothetical protein